MKVGDHFPEVIQGWGDVGSEMRLAAMNAQETVCSQSLHQALGGALPEDPLKVPFDRITRFPAIITVEAKEMLPLLS